MNEITREKEIIKTSIIGIIGNILLVGFKAFIGFLAGSVSIIMDALNNLTDALSSIITIVGTKLAGKRPNKKHGRPLHNKRGEEGRKRRRSCNLQLYPLQHVNGRTTLYL